jgi:acetoacetyl-CoA reductase
VDGRDEGDAMTATQERTMRTGDKLLGRVAFVTGGTRGIGAAIARSLAAQGADVAVGYSGNQEAAEAFARDFTSTFPDRQVTVHRGDIGSADDCRRTVGEVIEQHGRLDILVNNAGITADKTVRKMTVDDWDRVVQVNLSGAFYLSRAILQHMLDRGSGRIINISSIIGESGNIGQANYSAAKAGLFGLTMSLAQETARKGITVNSVAPGYISTEMVAAVPKEALDKVIAKIPAGRLGEPDEVARVVEFLADPESAFITGQVYSVNGGQYM